MESSFCWLRCYLTPMNHVSRVVWSDLDWVGYVLCRFTQDLGWRVLQRGNSNGVCRDSGQPAIKILPWTVTFLLVMFPCLSSECCVFRSHLHLCKLLCYWNLWALSTLMLTHKVGEKKVTFSFRCLRLRVQHVLILFFFSFTYFFFVWIQAILRLLVLMYKLKLRSYCASTPC